MNNSRVRTKRENTLNRSDGVIRKLISKVQYPFDQIHTRKIKSRSRLLNK